MNIDITSLKTSGYLLLCEHVKLVRDFRKIDIILYEDIKIYEGWGLDRGGFGCGYVVITLKVVQTTHENFI